MQGLAIFVDLHLPQAIFFGHCRKIFLVKNALAYYTQMKDTLTHTKKKKHFKKQARVLVR
jgi:hypothetical protein